MTIATLLKNKLLFTIVVALLVAAHLIWEFFHGGVVTHHILAREDLPGISNWWGLITVPLMTYLLISLLQRNVKKLEGEAATNYLTKISRGFFGAFLFGMVLSILWEFDLENILQYLILLPFILALFFPLFGAECLLGFILSMTYTFGGFLPILIGTVLMIIAFVIYKVIRNGFLHLLSLVGRG